MHYLVIMFIRTDNDYAWKYKELIRRYLSKNCFYCFGLIETFRESFNMVFFAQIVAFVTNACTN